MSESFLEFDEGEAITTIPGFEKAIEDLRETIQNAEEKIGGIGKEIRRLLISGTAHENPIAGLMYMLRADRDAFTQLERNLGILFQLMHKRRGELILLQRETLFPASFSSLQKEARQYQFQAGIIPKTEHQLLIAEEAIDCTRAIQINAHSSHTLALDVNELLSMNRLENFLVLFEEHQPSLTYVTPDENHRLRIIVGNTAVCEHAEFVFGTNRSLYLAEIAGTLAEYGKDISKDDPVASMLTDAHIHFDKMFHATPQYRHT
ncbi:MAG: hypothetical protein WC477_04895 [Patescibacteria group bacterium]